LARVGEKEGALQIEDSAIWRFRSSSFNLILCQGVDLAPIYSSSNFGGFGGLEEEGRIIGVLQPFRRVHIIQQTGLSIIYREAIDIISSSVYCGAFGGYYLQFCEVLEQLFFQLHYSYCIFSDLQIHCIWIILLSK
jgi:hypothetical protein